MFIDLVSAIFQLYCGTKLFFLGEGGPDRYSEVTGEISARFCITCFICIVVGDPIINYQDGRVEILLTV
jgi:hypothetical protein